MTPDDFGPFLPPCSDVLLVPPLKSDLVEPPPSPLPYDVLHVWPQRPNLGIFYNVNLL